MYDASASAALSAISSSTTRIDTVRAWDDLRNAFHAFFFLFVYRLRLHRLHVDEVGGLEGREVEIEVDTVHVEDDLQPI